MNNSVIKPLLWVPRYWPAIGGAELHNRKLAHELTRQSDVGVITHCDLMNLPLPAGVAASTVKQVSDNAVMTYRTGINGISRSVLLLLGGMHANLRCARPLYAWMFRRNLSRQVNKVSENYTLIHYVYNGLTESAELASDTARRRNIPFVLTPLTCTDDAHSQAWSSKRFKRLYQRANAIIALTDHERTWLINQGAKAERVFVCPYGPLVEPQDETINFRQTHGIGDAPLVLFLGRATIEKGCDLLLGAANAIWKLHPETRIAFIGPQDEEVKKLFKKVTDRRLLCLEKVTQSEKSAALSACTLLCVPSRTESLGVVYLEAWHYQKPVVALEQPVLSEVIEHEKDGLLATHNSCSVAKAVCKLLANPEKSRIMGNHGHKKLASLYNWQIITSTVLAIYKAAKISHEKEQ